MIKYYQGGQMKLIKEYDFSLRPAKMIIPVILFGALAAFFFFQAANNDRGLIINGIFTLDAGGATVFFYVMAGLSCLFVLAGAFGIINGLTVKEKLTIYSDGIEMPVRKEKIRLYFRDLASAQVLDIYGTRILEISAKDGKKQSIVDSKLGKKAEFDGVCGLIAQGIEKGQVE